jgi:hypothetical protein
MQYTTPIFLGGLVRWLVEMWTQPAGAAGKTPDEAKAIAESETGPGLLLASGYIAGGTLAGVVIAFMQLPFFAPETEIQPGTKVLVQYQEQARHATVEAVNKDDNTATVSVWDTGETITEQFDKLTVLPTVESDWAPWTVFILLMVFLALVALGKLLPSPPLEDERER